MYSTRYKSVLLSKYQQRTCCWKQWLKMKNRTESIDQGGRWAILFDFSTINLDEDFNHNCQRQRWRFVTFADVFPPLSLYTDVWLSVSHHPLIKHNQRFHFVLTLSRFSPSLNGLFFQRHGQQQQYQHQHIPLTKTFNQLKSISKWSIDLRKWT